MIRRVCGLIVIIFSGYFSGGNELHAQLNPAEKLKQSIEEREYSHARIQLAVLLAEQSEYLPQVVDQAEFLALYSDDTLEADPGFASLDSLKQIYDICIRIDGEKRFEWMLRRAMLFMNYPEYFAHEKEPALKACLTTEPVLCPVLIAEALAKSAIERYRKGEISLEELAFTWASTDQYFTSRMLSAGKLKAEIEAARIRIYEMFDKTFPLCAGIQDHYLELSKSSELSAEMARAVLCLFFFRKCENSPLAEALFALSNPNDLEAWWYRRLAYISPDPDAAIRILNKSFLLETKSELKALDLWTISFVLVSKQDFKTAMRKLEQASVLAPSWGGPQLAMADVLITGAATCGFDPFTRKAVYWAAIDLCRQAIDRDPGSEKEANEKIFEYRKLAPTHNEAAIRNLGMGDTWPLGCWMEKVAVVRF